MPAPDIAIPSRAPAEVSADDTVLPFEVSALDLRGRVVRLGPAVDQILEGHNYPQPVAKLLGEAIVLGMLLGTALKFEGRFILQTKTDGPVPMLVVDFTTPGNVRACARMDKNRVAEAIAAGKTDAGSLLGRGHLAMTIDQGGDRSRYQGLVALEGGTLEDAAHEYFLRSEQIPTRVRLAVAEDDAWIEGRSLAETIEDIELIDPAVSSERLLYRLFHERGVRVFRATQLTAQCSCSRESVEAILRSFPQSDRDDMVENGLISVTCEFCSQTYVFEPTEVADEQMANGE